MAVDADIMVTICEGVAAFLRSEELAPPGCSVEVDYVPDLSLEETSTGRLIICPAAESTAAFTRGGVTTRNAEIQIGFLRRANKHDVPELLNYMRKIARSLEFSPFIRIPGVTPMEANRELLYDVNDIRAKALFKSVISLKLKVSECL